MNRSESGDGYTPDMLLVGWDGLDAPRPDPDEADFWPAALAREGTRARLSHRNAWDAGRLWRQCLTPPGGQGPSESLFSRLRRQGLSSALVNLPWPDVPEGNEVFFIGRPRATGQAPPVHPPELALDLADYLGDPLSPAPADPSKFSRGLADLAFAEQAAVCRIRFEHTLRLAREHCPAVLAVSLGGSDLLNGLGPGSKRRRRSLQDQLSFYGAALDRSLAPRAVVVLSAGGPGRPGRLLARGPGLAPGNDLGALVTRQAARLLETTALAAHASRERAS